MSDLIHGSSVEKIEDEQYQLILPCDVKDFNHFVSGLLGKPQEEKGKVTGCFHVEPKDITNIYHLITQRVNQQNDGSLAHFSIEVLYDNGTSITHNDIKQFESYYPTSKTTPKEVVISFTYVLEFKNKTIPEKQNIEVVISLDDDRLHQTDAWIAGGVFEYSIKHTDRTWASDISNVLENHATNFMYKYSGFMKWIRRYEDDVFEYIFLLVMFGFCSYWYFTTKDIFFSETSGAFAQAPYYEHWLNFGYIALSLATFIKIVEKIACYRFYVRRPSFITLIDKDYDFMVNKNKKNRNKMFAYVASLITNIAAGVAASYFYANTLA